MKKFTQLEFLLDILKSPRETDSEPFWRPYMAATMQLLAFLGKEWFKKFIVPSKSPAQYFNPKGNPNENAVLKIYRIIDFAECLYNLHGTPGFTKFVDSVKNRSDIEAIQAELFAAKMLRIHGVKFKFVEPSGNSSNDFDLDIIMPDGTSVAGETKCKIEGMDIGGQLSLHIASLSNTFKTIQQKKQLPKDRPGVVLVRIPGDWIFEHSLIPSFNSLLLFNDEYIGMLRAAAEQSFRNSSRVSEVIFFMSSLHGDADAMTHALIIKSFINPDSPFAANYSGLPFHNIELGEVPNWTSLHHLVA